MDKILTIEQAINLSEQLHKEKKVIVLAGGCFDILHIGHIEFLRKAKKQGEILFLLLESDQNIKKLKGENRPINTQNDRAKILAELESVDFIVLLPQFKTNNDYDDLIIRLKPDKIATTKGDLYKTHKERQAKLINAKVVEVIDNIKNRSTSRLIKLLSQTL